MSSTTARPPFDPETEAALAAVSEQVPVITREMIAPMRDTPLPISLTEEMLDEHGIARREITVLGYEGAELEATVLSRADHTGVGPGIYHIHGGGMILGDRTIGLGQLLPWIAEYDAVAVSVEYRLAPDFPDPYPVEDCYAGLTWTADNAAELGIDPQRLMIAGASAGGGLTAGTALLARDRKGPALIGQLLDCPMIDDRDSTVSAQQYEDQGTWVRESNRTGWSALLGDRVGGDDVSIYAAPARATDLSGLPPTIIICGSAEVFRDEDVAYATALWRDGVQAELHVLPGGYHGFDMLVPHASISQVAANARDAWVARILGD